ncbi:MAG: hypothetical protein J7L14_02445 [Candidatus Diapherotrites archaeon]|nr:hypothetical protein [Candidatus Diapherotrites archaeon]
MRVALDDIIAELRERIREERSIRIRVYLKQALDLLEKVRFLKESKV